VLQQKVIAALTTVSVENLVSGVYLLKLEVEGKTHYTRFIKH